MKNAVVFSYTLYNESGYSSDESEKYATIVDVSGNINFLTIPETVDGHHVKRVFLHDYYEEDQHLKALTSITVPDSLEELELGGLNIMQICGSTVTRAVMQWHLLRRMA